MELITLSAFLSIPFYVIIIFIALYFDLKKNILKTLKYIALFYTFLLVGFLGISYFGLFFALFSPIFVFGFVFIFKKGSVSEGNVEGFEVIDEDLMEK